MQSLAKVLFLIQLFTSIYNVNSFLSYSIRPTIHIRQSHHTQLSMNLIDRFFRVVTSNVNNVIKNMEDPEKIIEQAVEDMQVDLVKIRQSYAEVFASSKRLQKQKTDADTAANDWYRRAQLALEKGNEDLAREALARRKQQVELADKLGSQLATQTAIVDKLFADMQTLENKVLEAKREKDLMVARAKTAKTSIKVNDMLTSSGSNAMEAFDRMKAKMEALETEAEVKGELAAVSSGTTLSLEDKFRELERSGGKGIDDELELLKRQLPSGKKDTPPPQLPREVIIDPELEQLRRDLGR